VAKVKFDAGLQTPLEQHFVDGDGAFALVHGRAEVPRCVEVRSVVGREPYPFDGAAFTIGKALTLSPGKNLTTSGAV
jgi:hypothetical protein